MLIIDSLKEEVKKGNPTPLDTVATGEFSATFVRNYRGLGELTRILRPLVARPPPCVIHVRGEPGVGKSRLVHELFGNDAYWKPADDMYWNGYSSHRAVIIDDIQPTFAIGLFLRIADRYPLQLPCKLGAYANAQFEYLLVTSNGSLNDIWPAYHSPDAISRRVHLEIELKRDRVSGEVYAYYSQKGAIPPVVLEGMLALPWISLFVPF